MRGQGNGRVPAQGPELPRVVEPDNAIAGHTAGPAGAGLLLADLRTGIMLANEARYRTLEYLFGVRREQANLATVIALIVLLEAAHDKADRWLRGPGGPTRADVALGVATGRELLYEVGGLDPRDTPLVGTLVAVAVLGGLSGLVLRRSARGITTFSHRAGRSFNHRYGHLIGRRPAAR